MATTVAQLDFATFVKTSRAVSEELVLERLIERLMVIAVEHAGAERGLLLLPHSDELRIVAEAKSGRDRITVSPRTDTELSDELPESVLREVMRSRESVLLNDALTPNPFSTDDYIQRTHPRSILCLPLIKQGRLVGAIYLENSLSPGVFTPVRATVLQQLASQAAISLENARLYHDLQLAEESARQGENKVRVAFDTIPALAWSALPDGRVEFLSQQWHDYTGIQSTDEWQTSFHPDDLGKVVAKWLEILASGESGELEARMRRFDGAHRCFLIRAMPQHDDGGSIIRWYGTNTDIEDRKQAEEKLRQSEAYLSEAQRLSRTGSFGWVVATGEIIWSEETFRIFQIDRTTKPTVELLVQHTHPEDRALLQQTIERAAKDGKDFDFEHRLLMPDGSIKHLRVVSHAERDESNELEFVGAVMDVTASKQIQARLQASLDEKDALLKEVHHRVKNNLQLISSLLSLQAARIADPAIAELFAESRNRVRSMALVHENLYRAGNFAKIAMTTHVANLCAHLARVYGLGSRHVELVTEIDDIELDLDLAISAGLIINELVSNALKHAFPSGRTGRMRVGLKRTAAGACDLIVQDDGIGLPSDFDVERADSLGLQLVHNLTLQLHGTIAVKRDNGTTFVIEFPANGNTETSR